MKDWTGDSNSVFKMLGASNHSKSERHPEDYYATDPKAIDALLKAYELPKVKIWEPSCEQGHLAKRLEELGYEVFATDLVDRGYGKSGVDFFAQMDNYGCDCILTNPPYVFATDYVLHALRLLPEGGLLILFLRTLFLEGQERYEKIYKHNPPKYVFQFSKRINCAKNGEFEKYPSTACAYAWFIWEKGYKGDTIIKWI